MHQALFYVAAALPALAAAGLILLLKPGRNATLQTEVVVRTASLSPAAGEGSGRWLLGLAATLLPLAGTAVLLKIRWSSIPQRFPVHWGISGQPDRWAERSAGGVFGLLAVAAVLIAGIGLLGHLVARSSPGHEVRETAISLTRSILLAAAWLLTILFCGTSLLPLAHDPTRLVPILVIGSILSSVGLIALIAYRAIHSSSTLAAARNSTEGQYWRAGIFYYNPSDSALMVPKRSGLGYTLNFGRPVAWIVFAGVLAIPILLGLLLRLANRRS